MLTVTAQIARRDFSATTLRTLGQRGIELVSVQALPGAGALPWANAERGYLVNDNGTGRVWTFAQVIAKAGN
jgi:hypothetical protein